MYNTIFTKAIYIYTNSNIQKGIYITKNTHTHNYIHTHIDTIQVHGKYINFTNMFMNKPKRNMIK